LRAEGALAARQSRRAAGDGLPVPRPVLRDVEAREAGPGRELGHPRARARKRVRPRGRRQELALPAGRDLFDDGSPGDRRRPLRSSLELLPRLPRAEALPSADQRDGHAEPESVTLKTPRRFSLRSLLLAAAFVAALAMPAPAEEKSLLAADGTLFEVHAGLAV